MIALAMGHKTRILFSRLYTRTVVCRYHISKAQIYLDDDVSDAYEKVWQRENAYTSQPQKFLRNRTVCKLMASDKSND